MKMSTALPWFLEEEGDGLSKSLHKSRDRVASISFPSRSDRIMNLWLELGEKKKSA